jgi:hypothetical protein
MGRVLSWSGHAVLFAALLLTRSLLGAEEVNLVLLGDWGADPTQSKHVVAQKRTAKVLGDWVKTLPKQPDAVLLLGDNFYGTLKGVDDARWDSTFRRVYPPEIFKMDFYFLLGNHDFEDGQGLNWKYEIAYAATGKDTRWKFPATDPKDTWYRIDLPTKDDPLVTVFMFNSSEDAITTKIAAKKSIANWSDQAAWLQAQLKESRKAVWLAGAAHYPMFTNGHHYGDDKGKKDADPWIFSRRDLMKPLLAAKAQFWLGAHDHNLQFLHDPSAPGMEFTVSGGGAGDSLYGQKNKQTKDYFLPGPGWVQVTFARDKATTRYFQVKLGAKKDGSKDVLKPGMIFERTVDTPDSIVQPAATPAD